MEMVTEKLLQSFIANVARTRLSQSCQGQVFDLSSGEGLPVPGEASYYESLIVLRGNLGFISLRFHYELETARRLAALSAGVSPGQMTEALAHDFMCELCNVVGGYVKGFFEGKKVATDLSLPFRNGEDAGKSLQRKATTNGESVLWSLGSETGVVMFRCEVCLSDPKTIDDIAEDLKKDIGRLAGSPSSVADGEIEFF